MALNFSWDEEGNLILIPKQVEEPPPLPISWQERMNSCDRTQRDVDVEALPFVLWNNRRHLPTCPAVYFFLTDCRACRAHHEVLYVGQAHNLRRRITQKHHRTRQAAAVVGLRVAWMKVESLMWDEALNDLESREIFRFTPLWDRMLIPSPDEEYVFCSHCGTPAPDDFQDGALCWGCGVPLAPC